MWTLKIQRENFFGQQDQVGPSKNEPREIILVESPKYFHSRQNKFYELARGVAGLCK